MNKNEKLYEAIGGIGDDLITDAREKHIEKKKGWRRAVLPAVAGVAILVGAAALLKSGGDITQSGNEETTVRNKNIVSVDNDKDLQVNTDIGSEQKSEVLEAHVVAHAQYPVTAPYPIVFTAEGGYDAWLDDMEERTSTFYDRDINIDDFITTSVEEILTESDGENVVYSPLNVYMALGMLAEITDGSSRQQILDLLGVENMEELRGDASALWNAHYRNDGAVTSLLASSLWLNQNVEFSKEPLNVLADTYYASSYQGDMGSQEFTEAFQAWLDENTGGMLSDQIQALQMTPETILSLATTVFFSARWDDEFEKENTDTQTFYGEDTDYICQFMNEKDTMEYYWGDKFSSVCKPFCEGGSMYFVLPDEGVEMDTLLKDSQFEEFLLTAYRWKNRKRVEVNFSVPKFDVSSQIDLIENLKNLGVTEVFDDKKADFSAIIEDSTDVALNEVLHGARVKIDEEGCVAAAYAEAMVAFGADMPVDEVDFVLNRPFIFIIRSDVGMPIFVGVVNQPE